MRSMKIGRRATSDLNLVSGIDRNPIETKSGKQAQYCTMERRCNYVRVVRHSGATI